ncbi:unnamed protein product, partial [Polarella glacialis]
DLEAEFASGQSARVCKTYKMCNFCGFLAGVVWLAFNEMALKWEMFTDLHDEVRLAQLWAYFIAFSSCIPGLPYVVNRIGPRLIERYVIVISLPIVTTLIQVPSKNRVGFALGLQPELIWPEESLLLSSDSLNLTSLIIVLVTFYTALPIRCSVSWPTMFLFPAVYAALLLPLPADRPEGTFVDRFNLIVRIFFLGVLGFLARANSEMTERKEFVASKYVKEKMLAEEEARRSNDCSGQEFPARAVSAVSSHAAQSSVAESFLYFNSIQAAAGRDHLVPQLLAAVKDLGRREHWLLNSKYLEVFEDSQLGQGSFGAVFVGRLHGSVVAIKASSKLDKVASVQSFCEELRVLRHIRHPDIVNFYGACIDPDRMDLLLVFELVKGLNLSQVINHTSNLLTAKIRREMLLSICRAFRYLHQQQPVIVHGDLKPDNVLVETKTCQVKLADFGLSRLMTPMSRAMGGTMRWCAPEVLLAATAPSPSSDIFSIGRCAFFVITGLTPLTGMHRDMVLKYAESKELVPLDWPEAAVAWQKECCELCNQILSPEAEERPGIEAVLAEVWQWAAEEGVDPLSPRVMPNQGAWLKVEKIQP